MVCLERVRQHQATWDCHNCYQIFHLTCIKKWATTARTDTGGWRCPGCQAVSLKIPADYRCFCRKLKNPEWNRNEGLVPHSCGEVCGRSREDGCVHTCVDICHAGPCSPCMATILFTCPCNKKTSRIKCGEEFTCEDTCQKVLNCGLHTCEQVCHTTNCQPCQRTVHQTCYCGRNDRQVVCTIDTVCVTKFACLEECGKSKDCGNHFCTESCHSGECAPCTLTTDIIKSCPCGQTPLEDLYNNGVKARSSCLDPIPTCEKICNKKLVCGSPSDPHTCLAECHNGPCPPCPKSTVVRCRCGHMDKEIPCTEMTGHPDDVRCEKKCQKKRSCGRHKCGKVCCIDPDHICTLVCGRMLSCALHRCEELCHSGVCKTCHNVAFDELTCTCGATIKYPPIPCGTSPPECQNICTRRHSCSHPVTHTCHSEATCPPCAQLTTKLCFGGHEERKNVACLVEGISCGKPCGKSLPCGLHTCNKICHAGLCVDSKIGCVQPCQRIRDCGHVCAKQCHPGDCPDSVCKTQVRITCECGNRSATVPCSENQYSRMTTAMLANRMQDLQSGNSVSLTELQRKDKKLECSEECFKLERNKRLSLALQIRNPELSAKITPKYSDFMRDFAKKDAKFCSNIHDELTKLVQSVKECKQKTRIKSFECMKREKRQLVHEYAEHFGCTSESFDAEPKRNVVATAYKERSWLPAISLLEFVTKQKKVKAPSSSDKIMSAPVVMTTLAKSSSNKKIDWFD